LFRLFNDHSDRSAALSLDISYILAVRPDPVRSSAIGNFDRIFSDTAVVPLEADTMVKWCGVITRKSTSEGDHDEME
jgi:hypothetical protein